MRIGFAFLFLLDGADGGAGGGAPTGPAAAPSAPAAPAAPAAAPAGGGAPAPGAAAAAAAARKFEYDEDRSAWVPPGRLTAAEQRAIEARVKAERFQRMLEAGDGFRAPREIDPKNAAAFQRLMGLIRDVDPELADTLDSLKQNAKQFKELLQAGPGIRNTVAAQEKRQAMVVVDTLLERGAEALGVEPSKLTKFQKQYLGNGFSAWLESDRALLGRYDQGDADKLIDDYLEAVTNGFLVPSGRRAAAGDGRQAQVNGRLPAAPRGGGAPPARGPAKPKSEDEVHDNAWKAWQAATAGQ
jgi:hypothetical protein